MKNLIYVRGDGCGDFVDTNSASDWQIRWQLLGGSAHCGDREHTGTFSITPLIGPENGIHDVLSWINGAEDSLHIHIYQFHSDVLAEALINAHERGVAITVVIDAGDSWWSDYKQGHSSDALAGGNRCEVVRHLKFRPLPFLAQQNWRSGQ